MFSLNTAAPGLRPGLSDANERPGLMARRRELLVMGLLLFQAPLLVHAKAQPTRAEVWKGPTCGCCGDWIKHLEANGFEVKVQATGNADIRNKLGMPTQYGSCHTALIEGYAIEGHVPAREIRRLLREKPKAVGLAAPAMPLGAPGMDGPEYGGRRTPHDVLLVRSDGSASVYQAYR